MVWNRAEKGRLVLAWIQPDANMEMKKGEGFIAVSAPIEMDKFYMTESFLKGELMRMCARSTYDTTRRDRQANRVY